MYILAPTTLGYHKIMNNDQQQWIPQGYQGINLAIGIAGGYVICVILGVSGYHPLVVFNQFFPFGDVLWGALTMWLCTGLFINAHDAMHGLILPKNPKANAFVGQVCLWLYAGLSYKKLLRGHIEHECP